MKTLRHSTNLGSVFMVTGMAENEKQAKALIVIRGFAKDTDSIDSFISQGRLCFFSVDRHGQKHYCTLK